MRFLGLGQLWNTGLRLVSVMFLCQLLSPLVALLAIVVSGSEMAGEAESHTRGPIPPDLTSVITEATSQVTEATEASECCDLTRQTAPCPSDHLTSPSLCQDPEVACSDLPLQCVKCECDYSCSYGEQSQASCAADTAVLCSGDRNFTRQFICSYCFLSDEKLHKCSNRDIGCRSVGSPSSKAHWYIANCSLAGDTLCLGKSVFSKRRECDWTEGYSWTTALLLSVTLGGFGADRFYLGHWQEGIGKLFSFGGIGVWTLVDVVLVATGYIGPADGSLYI